MQRPPVVTTTNLLFGGAGLYQSLVAQHRDEAVELAVEFLDPIERSLGRFHRRHLLSLDQCG